MIAAHLVREICPSPKNPKEILKAGFSPALIGRSARREKPEKNGNYLKLNSSKLPGNHFTGAYYENYGNLL